MCLIGHVRFGPIADIDAPFYAPHGSVSYTSMSRATTAGSYLLVAPLMSHLLVSQPFEPVGNQADAYAHVKRGAQGIFNFQ